MMSDSIYRKAKVYVQGQFSGILEETDAGYYFTYDSEYIASPSPLAVSLTLPLQKEPYVSKTLFSFFDGLIPEGWLLNVVSKNWKIDKKDRFGILLASCRDSIGDVVVEAI